MAYKLAIPEHTEHQIDQCISYIVNTLRSPSTKARKAERRLQKNYPEAEYLVMKGYGHCGFQMERPEEYAQLMSKEAFSKVERS